MSRQLKAWELLELLSRGHKNTLGKQFRAGLVSTLTVCDHNGIQVLKGALGSIVALTGLEVITAVEIPMKYLEAVNSGGKIRPEKEDRYMPFKFWMSDMVNTPSDEALEMMNGNWYVE